MENRDEERRRQVYNTIRNGMIDYYVAKKKANLPSTARVCHTVTGAWLKKEPSYDFLEVYRV